MPFINVRAQYQHTDQSDTALCIETDDVTENFYAGRYANWDISIVQTKLEKGLETKVVYRNGRENRNRKVIQFSYFVRYPVTDLDFRKRASLESTASLWLGPSQ
jgi:hypothetical protein